MISTSSVYGSAAALWNHRYFCNTNTTNPCTHLAGFTETGYSSRFLSNQRQYVGSLCLTSNISQNEAPADDLMLQFIRRKSAVRHMMFYLHDHSAKYEQQHALWKACFHTHTANVSLSIPLARTAAQCCSILLKGTVPQINRYTLQAVGEEGSNVNGPVGSPVYISPAATVPSAVHSLHSFVKVKAWMWHRRWLQPVFSVACPMWRKAVWRCGEAALHRAPCAPTRTNSTACCT